MVGKKTKKEEDLRTETLSTKVTKRRAKEVDEIIQNEAITNRSAYLFRLVEGDLKLRSTLKSGHTRVTETIPPNKD